MQRTAISINVFYDSSKTFKKYTTWHSVRVSAIFFSSKIIFLRYTNMTIFVFAFSIHSCKIVNLALFRCGVCPVASKSTVYLLCVALLLLPAHVCLGFWDRSPGQMDHTCGECELGTQTSFSKRGGEKSRNCSDWYKVTKMLKMSECDTKCN